MAFTNRAGTADSRAGNVIAGLFLLAPSVRVWEFEQDANRVDVPRRRRRRVERATTIVSPVELTPLAPEPSQWWPWAMTELPPPRRRKLPKPSEFVGSEIFTYYPDTHIWLLLTRMLEGGFHRGGPN